MHVYRGGVLKQQATERGRLLVKKPGKMRWNTSPEKKTFVSTPRSTPTSADRQVIVSTVPPEDRATPAMFLTGKGNITRDYTVAFDQVPRRRRSQSPST